MAAEMTRGANVLDTLSKMDGAVRPYENVIDIHALSGSQELIAFLDTVRQDHLFYLKRADQEVCVEENEILQEVKRLLAQIQSGKDISTFKLVFQKTRENHFVLFLQNGNQSSRPILLRSERKQPEPTELPEMQIINQREANRRVIEDVTALLTKQLEKYSKLYIPDSKVVVTSVERIKQAIQMHFASKVGDGDDANFSVSYDLHPLSNTVSNSEVDTENPLYAVSVSVKPFNAPEEQTGIEAMSDALDSQLWILPDTHETDDDAGEFTFTGLEARHLVELIQLWPDELSDAFPDKLVLNKLKNGLKDFPWESLHDIFYVSFSVKQKKLYISHLLGDDDNDGVSVFTDVGSATSDHPEGKWVNTLSLLLRNHQNVEELLKGDTLQRAREQQKLRESPGYSQQDHNLFPVPDSLGLPNNPNEVIPNAVREMTRRYRTRLNAILNEVLADGKGDVLGAILDAYTAVTTEFTRLSVDGIPLDADPNDQELKSIEIPREKFYSVFGILDDEEVSAATPIKNGSALEMTWVKTVQKVKEELQYQLKIDIQSQFAAEANSRLRVLSDKTSEQLREEIQKVLPKKRKTIYTINGREVSKDEFEQPEWRTWFKKRDKQVTSKEEDAISINPQEIYRLCLDFLNIPKNVRQEDKATVQQKLKSYEDAFQVSSQQEQLARVQRQFAAFAALMPDLHSSHNLTDFPEEFIRYGGMGAEDVVIELLQADEDTLSQLADYLENGVSGESAEAFQNTALCSAIQRNDGDAIRALFLQTREPSERKDVSKASFDAFVQTRPQFVAELFALQSAETARQQTPVIDTMYRDARESRRIQLQKEFLAFAKTFAAADVAKTKEGILPLQNTLRAYLEDEGLSEQEARAITEDDEVIVKILQYSALECLSDFAQIDELHTSVMDRLRTLKVHVQIPYTIARPQEHAPSKPTPEQLNRMRAFSYLMR